MKVVTPYRRIAIILFVVLTCFILPVSGQTAPVLKFTEGRVWVTGIGTTSITDDQWKDIFRVYTQDAFVRKINQPVAGTYKRHGDTLAFTPSFSFTAGGNYHAVLGKNQLKFSIPIEKISTTFVETIHPQTDLLPENTLRMYISFSGSMMPGEAYDHIKLIRENGTEVEKAFLIIDQELWDAERKRFTLLFDPGRVKRSLKQNIELGAPLQAGQTYRLVIDSAWRDVHGNSLVKNYTKTFTVTEAERTKLSIADWKITEPTAGTLDDLIIEFDRPIDHVLASKCINISINNNKVSGRVMLTSSSHWRFTPDQPWVEDQYHLEVYPHLEDVTGNNFNRVFDVDLSKESRENSSELVKYSFLVRPLVK